MIKTNQKKHAKKLNSWYRVGGQHHCHTRPMIHKPCKVVSIRNRLRKQKMSLQT